MRIDAFDYHLPSDLIAQTPAPRREAARLLLLDRATGAVEHRRLLDLPGLLAAGDLLVANDTRVLPARLLARRPSGGRAEILCLEPLAASAGGDWLALVRTGGRPLAGEVLALSDEEGVLLRETTGGGRWRVAGVGDDLRALLERHGRMPLPPYIRREPGDARAALDRERYQTVYARSEGAVAAPTAGLHLTPDLFEALAGRGVERAFLTLHVGLGTFEPVRCERLEDHRMHAERYAIPHEAVEAVRAARARRGRIVAIGTTTVRALEASAAGAPDGLPQVEAALTDLLIAPGYPFRVVDALLTNFHLPRSTLLALVSALAGREALLAAYAQAVRERYRFYSYGDAMLIL